MQTVNELREQLVENAIDILYAPAGGRLGNTLGIKRDRSARAILRKAEKAIESRQSKHARDKEAKAARLEAYRKAVENESEGFYQVDEDRQYQAEIRFVAAMVRAGRIEASELEND